MIVMAFVLVFFFVSFLCVVLFCLVFFFLMIQKRGQEMRAKAKTFFCSRSFATFVIIFRGCECVWERLCLPHLVENPFVIQIFSVEYL